MHKEEFVHFFLLPILIGIIGGLSAILFRKFISVFSWLFHSLDLFHSNYFYLITMPIIFYISNLLISKFLIDQSNVTIDNVAKRIALMQGKFSHTRGFLVLLLSSLSIGFGAPVGREGPIAKLGGLISEIFLKAIHAQKVNMPIYLSAGVSAAISATFNAPIAGIIFGLEIIIGKINSYIVIPLIIACTTATVISDHFIGDFTAFYVPKIEYSDSYFLYIPFLALFFAFLSLFMITMLKKLNKIRISYGKKWKFIAAGIGFIVGLIIVFVPEAKGVGYDAVSHIFGKGYPSHIAFEIFVAKIFVVALSVGAGIFGGLMSPSIFIGAFAGYWAGTLLPDISTDPYAFALVGSAAILAGVSKAPLRATIIVTELTHSYQLLPPMLMASAITGYVLSKFEPGSYFKRCLIQKGIDLENYMVDNFFQTFDVEEFTEKIQPLNPSTQIKRIKKIFKRFKSNYLPVVDENNKLIGIVSLKDIRKTYLSNERHKTIDQIMTKKPFSITDENTKNNIFKAFSTLNANYVPYTTKDGTYIGMINLSKILSEITFLEQQYEIDDKPKLL